MRTRRLGSTDLELTCIGLGTWAIGGGGWKFGWGPQDDNASLNAIHRALDLGINWIDTAPAYGLGHCEVVVGRALRGLNERPLIATKCGRCWEADRQLFPRLKAESVRAEAEASLRRLGVDVIDLYQIHWPQPDEDIEEAWGVVQELIAAGKIRYGGVSNFDAAQLARLRSIAPVASLQPPYSLLARGVEEQVLPYCAANNIGVIAYSPMQKGLLTGKVTRAWIGQLAADDHRRNDLNFQEPRLSAHLALVEALEQIAHQHGRPVAHVALAWVLRRSDVTAAIVGARHAAQIEATAAAADWELSADDLAAIDAALVRHEAALATA